MKHQIVDLTLDGDSDVEEAMDLTSEDKNSGKLSAKEQGKSMKFSKIPFVLSFV
jgi:hypothetical protein